MRTLICGKGEIGKSLYSVFADHYDTEIIDKGEEGLYPTYEILHIAFPYSDKFIKYVKEYQAKYKPKYTVIHSTVPPSTCIKLKAISSPCLGVHPHLGESLKVFTKFLGGKGASEVADYFRRTGMKVYVTDNSTSTELMKILDTTFYGVCVEYTKDVKKQCYKFDVPFELWTIWTNNYNIGYEKLGYPEYTRPNLTPLMKKIGGHCVLPNTELLETPFTQFINKLNE